MNNRNARASLVGQPAAGPSARVAGQENRATVSIRTPSSGFPLMAVHSAMSSRTAATGWRYASQYGLTRRSRYIPRGRGELPIPASLAASVTGQTHR